MSWEHWDEGLIPGWAQWVKDPAFLQLWLRSQLPLDLIPGPGTPYAVGQPEGKKKKKNFSSQIPGSSMFRRGRRLSKLTIWDIYV